VSDDLFYTSVSNTFLIWIMSIVPELLLALALALILHEKFIKGKHVFRAVFYFPNIVTPVTIGVLFSLLFDWQPGAVNRLLAALPVVNAPVNWLGEPFLSQVLVAAVMAWQWFGYNMLLYTAGLQAIPDEVTEAARRWGDECAGGRAHHDPPAGSGDPLYRGHLDHRRHADL